MSLLSFHFTGFTGKMFRDLTFRVSIYKKHVLLGNFGLVCTCVTLYVILLKFCLSLCPLPFYHVGKTTKFPWSSNGCPLSYFSLVKWQILPCTNVFSKSIHTHNLVSPNYETICISFLFFCFVW